MKHEFVTNKKYTRKPYTKFHLRIFWSVTSVLLLISVCFAGFQYIREKQYRIELLRVKLTAQADAIHEILLRGQPSTNLTHDQLTDSLLRDLPSANLRRNQLIDSLAYWPLPDNPNLKPNYRISIIDFAGNVLFDSEVSNLQNVENHATRKEVKQALETGVGYDVRRRSASTGEVYFFSAKKYEPWIIRIGAPYDSELVSNLKIPSLYIVITALILLIFTVVFYNVMRLLGANINRLHDFVSKAEHDGIDDYSNDNHDNFRKPYEDHDDFHAPFSNDEVGNISRHVVQIYSRLQKTKQALVAEQQLVLKQREEQERIKRQMTYNIAHELKTPVSSIQGYLETIINNKSITPERLENFIEKCYQQSTRLSSLLHDISTLTRIDEAPGLVSKERIELSKLIVDILEDTAIALKEKNIRVDNKTAALTLVCVGSQSLLYSVFRNLVDNTVAYAGEGVDIYIECNTEDSDYFFFSYSDNGVGIPNEHLERIFERFYRIDKGRSRKVGGTGLGLSIVKNAILLHGGAVTAEQRPGGGLAFVFSIRR